MFIKISLCINEITEYAIFATPQPCEFELSRLARSVDYFPYLTRVRVLHGKQVFQVANIAFMFQIPFFCAISMFKHV